MKLIIAALVVTAAAQAQTLPQFFQLKEYLQLTDTQYLAIFNNNNDISRQSQDAQRRISDLQREIATEIARDSPDAVEIGTRQVEAEKLCRAVREESRGLLAKNLALLTDAQRTKLRALEDAAKQASLISDAQGIRLLGDVTVILSTGQPGVVRVSVSPVYPTAPITGACSLYYPGFYDPPTGSSATTNSQR